MVGSSGPSPIINSGRCSTLKTFMLIFKFLSFLRDLALENEKSIKASTPSTKNKVDKSTTATVSLKDDLTSGKKSFLVMFNAGLSPKTRQVKFFAGVQISRISSSVKEN